LLRAIRSNALAVAGLSDAYSVVVLTGSGSSGNEAVLSSAVSPGEKVLALASGEFGQRLGEISRIYNPDTQVQTHGWGEAIDLVRLEETLRSQRIDWVTMVHHETSTGVLNPVAAVGALCKRYGARLFVDAVSSFSADPLDMEAANITFMSTSSGKAIGTYPGLALVFGRREAFCALEHQPVRNYYLSLWRHYTFMEEKAQTPTTPAVPLFLALNRALELVLAEGVDARYGRHAALASYVRRELRLRGLTLFGESLVMSNAVTSVCLPEGVDFEALRQMLRQDGYVIYGGKGPLANKIIQISTIGYLDRAVLDGFFVAFDRAIGTLLGEQESLSRMRAAG